MTDKVQLQFQEAACNKQSLRAGILENYLNAAAIQDIGGSLLPLLSSVFGKGQYWRGRLTGSKMGYCLLLVRSCRCNFASNGRIENMAGLLRRKPRRESHLSTSIQM